MSCCTRTTHYRNTCVVSAQHLVTGPYVQTVSLISGGIHQHRKAFQYLHRDTLSVSGPLLRCRLSTTCADGVQHSDQGNSCNRLGDVTGNAAGTGWRRWRRAARSTRRPGRRSRHDSAPPPDAQVARCMARSGLEWSGGQTSRTRRAWARSRMAYRHASGGRISRVSQTRSTNPLLCGYLGRTVAAGRFVVLRPHIWRDALRRCGDVATDAAQCAVGGRRTMGWESRPVIQAATVLAGVGYAR